MHALLYGIAVKRETVTRVIVTMTPNWLGRLLKRQVRRGAAVRGEDEDGVMSWWWEANEDYVGSHIEHHIAIAPMSAGE